MITVYPPETSPIRPEVWVGRRYGLPPAQARLIAELAFANRVTTLADRGVLHIDQSLWQCDTHAAGKRAAAKWNLPIVPRTGGDR